MHPVGDHEHAASLAVVEPRQQHRVEGFDGAFDLLQLVTNIVRIIDDYDVGATTGEVAAEGRQNTPPPALEPKSVTSACPFLMRGPNTSVNQLDCKIERMLRAIVFDKCSA